MATIVKTHANSDAEDLYRSFISKETIDAEIDALNNEDNNFIDGEQINFFWRMEGDFTREEFYKEYYESLSFDDDLLEPISEEEV